MTTATDPGYAYSVTISAPNKDRAKMEMMSVDGLHGSTLCGIFRRRALPSRHGVVKMPLVSKEMYAIMHDTPEAVVALNIEHMDRDHGYVPLA